MNKNVNLYKVCTHGCGTFYVVATSFDNAASSVSNALNEADYGYSGSRDVETVELMAKQEIMSTGKIFLSGEKNKLIISE